MLHAGELECVKTGFRSGWTFNSYPLPHLPRGVKLHGFWHSDRLCLEAGLWAPPITREEIAFEANADYQTRLMQGASDLRIPGTLTLTVRLPLGLRHFATLAWFPLLVLLVAWVVWRRRPGFDRDLQLGYRIEVEAGYRSSGQSEWQFTSVASLPGGRRRLFKREAVELDKALAPETELKSVRLEPFPGEEVMVRAAMPMLVQTIDETTSRVATNEVTITPGTVVRAGRLLFAVLSPEQVDSIAEGRVELPTPGSGGEEGRESVVEGLRASLISRLPGFWGWLLLAFGPPVAGLLFGMLGIVTDGTWGFFTIAGVMAFAVIVLQAFRTRVSLLRRRS